MPTELVQEIEARIADFPMSLEEANAVREKFREERKRKYEEVNREVPRYKGLRG